MPDRPPPPPPPAPQGSPPAPPEPPYGEDKKTVGLLLGNKSRAAGAILIGIAVLGVIFVYVLRDFVWRGGDDA